MILKNACVVSEMILRSPQYRLTHVRNRHHGNIAMTCEKTILPLCIRPAPTQKFSYSQFQFQGHDGQL